MKSGGCISALLHVALLSAAVEVGTQPKELRIPRRQAQVIEMSLGTAPRSAAREQTGRKRTAAATSAVPGSSARESHPGSAKGSRGRARHPGAAAVAGANGSRFWSLGRLRRTGRTGGGIGRDFFRGGAGSGWRERRRQCRCKRAALPDLQSSAKLSAGGVQKGMDRPSERARADLRRRHGQGWTDYRQLGPPRARHRRAGRCAPLALSSRVSRGPSGGGMGDCAGAVSTGLDQFQGFYIPTITVGAPF